MISQPPILELLPIEMPAMRGSHAVFPGLYFAATAPSSQHFRGGAVFESLDDWDSHSQICAIRKLATAGLLWWQSDTEARVLLTFGELSSCTARQVELGHNRAVAGSEVLGFHRAEMQPDGHYLLTVPVRGIHGTDLGGPGNPCQFVLLDDAIAFYELPPDTLSYEREYKAACAGQDLDKLMPVAVTPRGVNSRRFDAIMGRV